MIAQVLKEHDTSKKKNYTFIFKQTQAFIM